jgi:hypothetical protein
MRLARPMFAVVVPCPLAVTVEDDRAPRIAVH